MLGGYPNGFEDSTRHPSRKPNRSQAVHGEPETAGKLTYNLCALRLDTPCSVLGCSTARHFLGSSVGFPGAIRLQGSSNEFDARL